MIHAPGALRDLSDAVADFIVGMDKVMDEPPSYSRGLESAALVNRLRRAWDDAQDALQELDA